MNRNFPPLEFGKTIRKCDFCKKPTNFFVTEKIMSSSFTLNSTTDQITHSTPKVQYMEHPICPECYKNWEQEYRWHIGVFSEKVKG